MSERDLMEVKPTGLPSGVTPEQVAAEAESETPSAEEQQLYDKFVTRAIAFIHGEQTEGAVLDMLNQKDAPVHVNVGKAAAKIVQMVQQSAVSSGANLSRDLLEQAGSEVVTDLMETGVAAKIFPLEVDSKEYDQALEMSLLEGFKAYGEEMLAGPDGEKVSQQAQEEYLREVAGEADRGEIDPAFAAAMQRQETNPEFAQVNAVADGVQKAVQ